MATIIRGSGDDSVQGTDFKDTILAGGGNNTVDALAGNDVVTSGSGDDCIDGGAGNDTLSTGGGDDKIDGGIGNDIILAGTGDDLIFGGSGSGSDILDGGSGTDTVTYASSPAAVHVNLSTASGSGGDAQGDTLAGIDNLIGSHFNDELIGNALDNALNGGAGDDTIGGGAGTDQLTGGDGSDRFDFAPGDTGVGDNADSITDFTEGSDRIDLTAFGDLTFVGEINAMDAPGNDEFGYFLVGGNTVVRINDDGTLSEIRLENVPGVAESDFIFV